MGLLSRVHRYRLIRPRTNLLIAPPITIFVLGILLTGCASVSKGTMETLHVDTANCGELIPCTATNNKGVWEFNAPGAVRVKRSDDHLVISCKDGNEVTTTTLKPAEKSSFGKNVWVSTILGAGVVGGVIGTTVDTHTDANVELPDTTVIYRQYCWGVKQNPIN